MKILVICHEFPPETGGGGIVAYLIGKELAKKHQVDVLTARSGSLAYKEHRDGINIYRCFVLGRANLEKNTTLQAFISFSSFIISGLFSAIKLMVQNRYQSIYTFFTIPSGLIGIILSKLFKTVHVLTIIEADIFDPRYFCLVPYRSRIIKSFISFVLSHTTKVVSISHHVKEAAKTYYNCIREIMVISPSIEPITYFPVNKEKLGFSGEDFLIISIGRIVERKGFVYLIKAIHELNRPNIKTLIIGDGPLRTSLEELVKKFKLDSQVKFLGYLSNEKKIKHLSAGDIFVLSSLHKGFGIVFLEAMACGLPVITTDSGGQTDIIVDDENGFLVPIKDVDALVNRILILYNDKKLCKKISENNLVKVRKFFVSNIYEQYESLFKKQ